MLHAQDGISQCNYTANQSFHFNGILKLSIPAAAAAAAAAAIDL